MTETVNYAMLKKPLTEAQTSRLMRILNEKPRQPSDRALAAVRRYKKLVRAGKDVS